MRGTDEQKAPGEARETKAVTGVHALDAAAVRRWAAFAAAALERNQAEINGLNVFPIADRDTGTNMALTARSAQLAAARETADEVGAVLAALAAGAVQGARGNSGVILAQLWRGLADVSAGRDRVGPVELAGGLSHAADRAYDAVGDPVEGTILTVARAAAAGAAACLGRRDANVRLGRGEADVAAGGGDVDIAVGGLAAVAGGALTAARDALLATTAQLAALQAAGVVDAGGRGLVVVLEALLGAVGGDQSRPPSVERVEPAGVDAPVGTTLAAATVPADFPAVPTAIVSIETVPTDFPAGPAAYDYEVQYLLEADAGAVDRLRQELLGLGDSLAVADGGGGHWNVHVHVHDAGAAIEAGVRAGRPHRIEVTRFADQNVETLPRGGVTIIAVGLAPGLAGVFRGEGVTVVPLGPAGHPEARDVLSAIRSCGSGSVVLLPDPGQDDDVCARAAARARADGINVAVLPTRAAVQALAAVTVHDPTRRFDDDVIRMAEAAAATRWAEVTVATEEALTSAGRCQAGDVLGLIAGEVVMLGTDPGAVGTAVVDRLLGIGGELVTVLLGRDAATGIGPEFVAHLARSAPHAEVDVLFAGQPEPMLLIGVE